MGRIQSSDGPFHVRVVYGRQGVLFAWNFSSFETAEGFDGVAIRRTHVPSKTTLWIGDAERTDSSGNNNNNKESEKSDDSSSSEATLSLAPSSARIRKFQWCDYGPFRGQVPQYEYTIMCFFRGEQKPRHSCVVSVLLPTKGFGAEGTIATFFNRGVSGSQAYAKKFAVQEINKERIDAEDQEKLKWLANGVDTALLEFLEQASCERDSLLVCAYELTWKPFLLALLTALKERRVDVRVVYDCKAGTGGVLKSTAQEAEAALEQVAFPRDRLFPRKACSSSISHNKFVVWLRDGNAQNVWTGSMNYTPGGVYGQLNERNVINDARVAALYAKYWAILSADPTKLPKEQVEALSPLPPQLEAKAVIPLFSPRLKQDLLYVQSLLVSQAKESSFLTAAFGVNAQLQSALLRNAKAEHFLLLESTKGLVPDLMKAPHLVDRIAFGSVLDQAAASAFDMAPESLTGLNDHVKFVHTKVMLIDAFSDDPIVIFGSGNFSQASVIKNDENQVIVRGDLQLADDMLINLLRMHTHFLWRSKVSGKKDLEPKKQKSAYWYKSYFAQGAEKTRRRNLMCPVGGATTAHGAANNNNSNNKASLSLTIDDWKKIIDDEAAKKSSVCGTIKEEADEFIVQFPYKKELVDALKDAIKPEHRVWSATDKLWKIKAEAAEELKALAARVGLVFAAE